MAKEYFDLMFNYPLPGDSTTELIQSLTSRISKDPFLASKFLPLDVIGEYHDRAAQWLSFPNYKINANTISFGVSGHQLLLSILLGFTKEGSQIACEPVTYNGWINIVKLTHRKNIVIPMDQFGMIPEALDEAASKNSIWGIFLMPSLHNPCATVMPLERRQAIVKICRKHNLFIIDDDAYRFLNPEPLPSFAHLMPEKTFWIQSLTKPLFPSLKTAFIVTPEKHIPTLNSVIRASAHSPSPLTLPWAVEFINSKEFGELMTLKKEEAIRRQEIASAELNGFTYQTIPTSFHIWLELPKKWNSLRAAEALMNVGVGVVPGMNYSANGTESVPAIRIALSGEAEKSRVTQGLRIVRRVLEFTGVY